MLLCLENFNPISQMSSGGGSMNGLDFVNRENLGATSITKNVKGNVNLIYSQDQETMELHSLASAQEKEILSLREQIALASGRVSQLLNEKYILERKFAELRLALDEKQNEVITSASNALACRKGDLEVNVNLLNELKVTEDDRHTFTSSLIGILAEYGGLPHVTNASALSNGIKHLHDQLQSKIRSSHGTLASLNSMIGDNPRNGFVDKESPTLRSMNSQLPGSYMGVEGFSLYRHHINGKYSEPHYDVSRYVQDSGPKQANSSMQSGDSRQLPNYERTMLDIDRNVAGSIADRNEFHLGSEQRVADRFPHHPIMQDSRVGSFGSEEERPGIEGFQIIGEATPGGNLLGCGYTVRGTSLCMFQWVRHYPDGTRQYIEGATYPDYVVTADDVDKIIAVECIPMDEQGRQGDLVRMFANDNKKITCDEEMQEEIDAYISTGLATFYVLILLDHSDKWEPATLFLTRSSFHVKVDGKTDAVIYEKYSKDLLIKIPSGLSAQFVVICSNGSSYPFSTSKNDIRMRDTLVLTLRLFQSKAFDEKRKGKA